METVVLRIEKADSGAYLISLFVADDENEKETWLGAARATAQISRHDAETQLRGIKLLDDPNRMSADDTKDGTILFAFLARDTVGTELEELMAVQPGAKKTPRRFVLDVRPPELSRLPWELLCKKSRFLFAGQAHVWMRGNVDVPLLAQSRPWPLKVLIVVGCLPDSLRYEEEVVAIVSKLRQVLHGVDYDVLIRPDAGTLFRVMGQFQPDVLHFIGHGNAEGSYLLFEADAGGAAWTWDTTRIINGLQNREPPLLVVLNACQSSVEPPDGISIAHAFLEAGARATIGMLGNIQGSAAVTFANALYGALVGGQSAPLLPDVLAKARSAIQMNSDPGVWALPVLELAVRPARVLPIQFNPDPQFVENFSKFPEFDRIEPFVDRIGERRLLRKCLDEEAVEGLGLGQVAVKKHILALRGDSKVGKTRVAHWGLEHCLRRGLQGSWLDLRSIKAAKKLVNVVEFMRLIRDGSKEPSYLQQGFLSAPQAFNRFNRDLNALLQGKKPPDEDPTGEVQDEGQPVVAEMLKLETTRELLFASFLDALKRATDANKPTVLALDQFEDFMANGDETYLRKYFLTPIARGDIPGLKLILVVTDAEHQMLQLPNLGSSLISVKVPRWEIQEVKALLAEYLGDHLPAQPQDFETCVRFLELLAQMHKGVAPGDIKIAALPCTQPNLNKYA